MISQWTKLGFYIVWIINTICSSFHQFHGIYQIPEHDDGGAI